MPAQRNGSDFPRDDCPISKLRVQTQSNRRQVPTNIAIIGGGAAMVAVIDQLIRKLRERPELVFGGIDLDVYEPRDEVGVGKAYQSDNSSVLTNQSSETMSLRSNDRTEYVQWLEEALCIKGEGRYFPRTLFGRYLQDRFLKLITEARSIGINVRVINDLATDLDRGNEIAIRDTQGVVRSYHEAVFCVGSGEGAPPYPLSGEGYINNPFPLGRTVGFFRPEANILILGVRSLRLIFGEPH